MEAIKSDYTKKGVKFFFIYKSLAHPEGGTKSYVAPFTIQERLAHIKQAYKELGNTIPWICDNMNNELKHALGDRPNSEFILDPDGKIVVLRDWSRPESLRQDLEKLVGKVSNPTRLTDLNLETEKNKPRFQVGVVDRPKIPRGLRPVIVSPQNSTNPFYVKLRVEAEPAVFKTGNGKVYLGFHLDPIHQVHWNNLAAPLDYEIVGPSSAKLSPAKDQFAKVKVESDVDPREFLLDAKNLRSTFTVKVNYFACSDIEGWCKPVSQEYLVRLEADKDGGSARRSGSISRPSANARPNAAGPQKNQGRSFTAQRFMSFDKNNDGKVSFSEMPPQLRRVVSRGDQNNDQAIDKQEAKRIEERFKRRTRRK